MISSETTILDKARRHGVALPASRTIDDLIDDDLKPAMRMVAADVPGGVAELKAAKARLRAASGRAIGRRMDFLERSAHVLAAHGIGDMDLSLTNAGLVCKRIVRAPRPAA